GGTYVSGLSRITADASPDVDRMPRFAPAPNPPRDPATTNWTHDGTLGGPLGEPLSTTTTSSKRAVRRWSRHRRRRSGVSSWMTPAARRTAAEYYSQRPRGPDCRCSVAGAVLNAAARDLAGSADRAVEVDRTREERTLGRDHPYRHVDIGHAGERAAV